MHLERDLVDTGFAGEFSRLDPVWNYHFFPLVVEDLQIFRRPGAGDPIRLSIPRSATGAAAEGGDHFHAEPGGEPHTAPVRGVVLARNFRVGMNRIAMHGE